MFGYVKSDELDASRIMACLNLGEAWAKAGDPDKAAKALRTYLELAPNGAGAEHARELLAKS